MHSVEMLDYLTEQAKRLGYQIRQDWLGGTTGGVCELRGTVWVFLDLSLPPEERLDQLAGAMAADPRLHELNHPSEVRDYLARSRAAG